MINASGRVLRSTGDVPPSKAATEPGAHLDPDSNFKGTIPFPCRSFGRVVVELVAPSSMKRVRPAKGERA